MLILHFFLTIADKALEIQNLTWSPCSCLKSYIEESLFYKDVSRFPIKPYLKYTEATSKNSIFFLQSLPRKRILRKKVFYNWHTYFQIFLVSYLSLFPLILKPRKGTSVFKVFLIKCCSEIFFRHAPSSKWILEYGKKHQ